MSYRVEEQCCQLSGRHGLDKQVQYECSNVQGHPHAIVKADAVRV